MSLLNMILENAGAVKQVAKNLNIDEGDATKGIAQLLPALMGSMKQNVQKPEGLAGLLGALQKGGHQRYLDRPQELASRAAIEDGNGILGHLLGSKDASRAVAGGAAQRTGLDVGVLKKMLPMVAAMAMGSMGKQTESAGIIGKTAAAPAAAAQSSAAMGLMSKLLDSDGDGSVTDDLIGMAKKFF